MSEPLRIAMWSGPRNISTAMMRAFGNRADCAVSDEPFYGAYLAAKSQRGSFDFNEVGINFTKSLGERLRFGIQFFARDVGPVGNDTPRVDWFFLDYRFTDWLGVRAGRLKVPFGLYNEVNDVDSARVPVLLPQAVYPILNRDLLLAQTGFELYGYHEDGGRWEAVGDGSVEDGRFSAQVEHFSWWNCDNFLNTDQCATGTLAMRLQEAGALVGATDHSTTKALYAKDPDGLEFEVCWIVPKQFLTDDVVEGKSRMRPLNLQAEEMLSAVVERLLKALREARPATVRQFFALASQHMRWELNDMARRLD